MADKLRLTRRAAAPFRGSRVPALQGRYLHALNAVCNSVEQQPSYVPGGPALCKWPDGQPQKAGTWDVWKDI